MQVLEKNKTAVEIIIGFVLVVVAYNLFSSYFVSTDVSLTASPTTLGADLLKMSQDLSIANLDQSLFAKPSYTYLTDFSTPIPREPVGRTNPFDTIGQP
ncbi:MAG: hypothetical protein AAB758_01255 [Patescibacteria group bacterium]